MLLEISNSKTKLFVNVSPLGYQHWIGTGAGKSGMGWTYSIMLNRAKVELYFAAPDAKINEKRFNTLFEQKDQIESDFGEKLIWDFKYGRKQHYIRSLSLIGGLNDENKWGDIQNDLVDRMIRLRNSLKSFISKF